MSLLCPKNMLHFCMQLPAKELEILLIKMQNVYYLVSSLQVGRKLVPEHLMLTWDMGTILICELLVTSHICTAVVACEMHVHLCLFDLIGCCDIH